MWLIGYDTDTKQPSGGTYTLGVNASIGYLMAVHSKCPREARKKKGAFARSKALPDLQRWADVAFLAYQERCGAEQKSVKGLSRVFRCEINNEESLETTSSVCEMDSFVENKMYTEIYQPDSRQGKALIGMLNGAGVAWMLLRHRDQLGRKVIQTGDHGGQPNPSGRAWRAC